MDKSQIALRLAIRGTAAFYILLFLVLGFLVGPFDYDHLSSYYHIAAKFWMHSPGAPHFNPYLCGGRTLGGDPQVPVFHPLIFVGMLLGPTWTIKLELLAQLGLGLWGLAQIFKRWNLSLDARLWGIFLFMVGGATISRFMVGHVTMGFFFLFPTLLYLSYEKRFTLYATLVCYCALYKPNFAVYGLPLLACEALFRTLFSRDWRPLGGLIGATAICMLVNAASMLPAWKYFSDFPRIDDHATKFIPWSALLGSLVLPIRALPESWYGPVFLQRHEYSVFLGPVALLFALWGIRQVRWNRPEWCALLALAVFSCLVGIGAPDTTLSGYPYSWLRKMWPGVNTVRVPVRYWFGVYLALIFFSAIGFRSPKTRGQHFGFIVGGILFMIFPLLVNLSRTVLEADRTQWHVAENYTSDFAWIKGSPEKNYDDIRQGKSILDCFSNVEVYPSHELHSGPLAPSENNLKFTWKSWNQIRLEGPVRLKAEYKLNLNHSPYWRFEGSGAKITSLLYQPLTIEFTADRVEGTLEFIQPGVRTGIWLSGLGLALLILLWGWCARRAKNLAI